MNNTELIEKLREQAEIEQAGHGFLLTSVHLMRTAADAIEKLQAERDAAVADLTAAGLCDYCDHYRVVTVIGKRVEFQRKCVKRGKCEFKWRGLKEADGDDVST